ncbi:MAG: ABC transporter permease [Bacillota bacterium]|nr:ABC transporter permease [Bacillota bacterium]
MTYLVRMAFRNLTRNRLRSAVSVLAITVAVAVVIFAKGFVNGMIDTFLENTIRFTTGHVRIVDEGYPKKERLLSLAHPVDGLKGEGAEAFARRLSQLPGVAVATPRLKFGALVSKGDKLEGVLGMGLDLQAEERAAHLSRYLHRGRFPREGVAEVLAGQKLLNKLGLEVGSKVTLVANTSFGSLNGRTFTVVGSLASGLAQLDEASVFLPLATAQRFVDLEGAATEVIVMARDSNRVPALTREIAEVVKSGDPEGRYKVIPWYQANSLMGYMVTAKQIYNLIYVLIVLFASFVVINTMLMIVNERTREIGMLGAMGFTGVQTVTLLVLEGAILGFLGSTIGTVAGSVITRMLSVTGIDFAKAVQSLGKELLFPTRIYPTFDLGIAAFAFVLGILVPALGTLMPARRAQKLDPSTALRAI